MMNRSVFSSGMGLLSLALLFSICTTSTALAGGDNDPKKVTPPTLVQGGLLGQDEDWYECEDPGELPSLCSDERGELPWQLEVDCEDGDPECTGEECGSISSPGQGCSDPPKEAGCETDVPDEEFEEAGGGAGSSATSSSRQVAFVAVDPLIFRGVLCAFVRWRKMGTGVRSLARLWARHRPAGAAGLPFVSGHVRWTVEVLARDGQWRSAYSGRLNLVRSRTRPTIGGHRRKIEQVLDDLVRRRYKVRVVFHSPHSIVSYNGIPMAVQYTRTRWVSKVKQLW